MRRGREGKKKESMVDGVHSKSKWVVRVVEASPAPCALLVIPVAYKGLRTVKGVPPRVREGR